MYAIDEQERFDMSAVRTKNLPRCDWRDFLKVRDGSPDGLTKEDEAAFDAYFSQFLPLGPCVGCGSKLTGGVVEQFMGMASFTWGLAHGQGFCGKCGYPARAYHFDIGQPGDVLISRLNVVLQWHPDSLVENPD